MINVIILIISAILCMHSFSFGIYTIRVKKNYVGGIFMLLFNLFAFTVLVLALYA